VLNRDALAGDGKGNAVGRASRAEELARPENVWMGVSIENNRWVERADCLRQVPAAVRFISAEPLRGHSTSSTSAASTG
jgi:protein gp37